MDPNFLLKDELEYELACRGIVLKAATAPVMKKLLTELMRSELDKGSGLEIRAPKSESVQYDLEICSAKLQVLSNYIAELTGKPDRSLFKRLISRLYHVQNRLSLLKQVTEAEGVRKEGLLQQCQVLVDKLEGQDDIVEGENLTVDDREILQNTLGELGRLVIQRLDDQANVPEDIGGASTSKHEHGEVLDRCDRSVMFSDSQWEQDTRSRPRLVRNSTMAEEEALPKRKLVPVHQWGLKFAGGKRMSVNAFLERVAELKEARNATDIDLWRYAIDFFEGDALVWFRANKEYVSSWDELVVLLKRAFQRPYYQEELLAEIRARTQGTDESVLIYISVMQNMFNRLPNRITESEKVLIIQKNLSPYYQRAICRDVFVSVSDMMNVLRIVERTKINCEGFEQPKMTVNVLEPDLAYRGVANRAEEADARVGEIAEIRSVQGQGPVQVVKRCWNCRESGHLFRQCTMPKQRLFCYRCGKFGITSKECSCEGNGQGRSSSVAN